MRDIILDGLEMTTKEAAHTYMKTKFEFPMYYGNNLDALWDLLSTYGEPICIHLFNQEALVTSLESYGEALIKVFEDAAKETENITFKIETL